MRGVGPFALFPQPRDRERATVGALTPSIPDQRAVSGLLAVGLHPSTRVAPLTGSMSASSVYRVRSGGGDTVLKVSEGDAGSRIGARRELRFYRELAGRVPVATPRLLTHADTDQITAMRLTAHRTAPRARQWPRSRWIEAVRQLALVHAFPVPARSPWVHVPWVRGVLGAPPADLARSYWSQTAAADCVGGILDDHAALSRALDQGPVGFIHGDCHVDNLLGDGPHLIWVDWQAAGIGSCGIDLAFLYGRALADGADPPYDEMVDLYVGLRKLDAAPLRRAAVAAELATLLFGWPHHMSHHTASERDRMTCRLAELARVWSAGSR